MEQIYIYIFCLSKLNERKTDRKIGWLVSLRQCFSLSSRLPEEVGGGEGGGGGGGGRKKRETIGETRKLFEQPLLAPTASTVGP